MSDTQKHTVWIMEKRGTVWEVSESGLTEKQATRIAREVAPLCWAVRVQLDGTPPPTKWGMNDMRQMILL